MRFFQSYVLTFTLLTSHRLASCGHANKRADDTDPLQAVVMKLSEDLSQLKAQQTADVNRLETQHSADLHRLQTQLSDLQAKLDKTSRHVSFLVQFSPFNLTTPPSGPFKFDHVIFNDGGHYDPIMGTFTAPRSGVYLLSVQFYTDMAEANHPILDIRLNGGPLVRMGFDLSSTHAGAGRNSHSSSVVVRLGEGDRVWVESNYNRAYTFLGSYHSFFSGALLYSVD